ncbi:MAG TPA: hypothetical protein VLL52_20580 [Anaerolineae bacterium]|nr:hypothetical protein [Anaerolineae bacterium]
MNENKRQQLIDIISQEIPPQIDEQIKQKIDLVVSEDPNIVDQKYPTIMAIINNNWHLEQYYLQQLEFNQEMEATLQEEATQITSHQVHTRLLKDKANYIWKQIHAATTQIKNNLYYLQVTQTVQPSLTKLSGEETGNKKLLYQSDFGYPKPQRVIINATRNDDSSTTCTINLSIVPTSTVNHFNKVTITYGSKSVTQPLNNQNMATFSSIPIENLDGLSIFFE